MGEPRRLQASEGTFSDGLIHFRTGSENRCLRSSLAAFFGRPLGMPGQDLGSSLLRLLIALVFSLEKPLPGEYYDALSTVDGSEPVEDSGEEVGRVIFHSSWKTFKLENSLSRGLTSNTKMHS